VGRGDEDDERAPPRAVRLKNPARAQRMRSAARRSEYGVSAVGGTQLVGIDGESGRDATRRAPPGPSGSLVADRA
jgi:hypothetical protein